MSLFSRLFRKRPVVATTIPAPEPPPRCPRCWRSETIVSSKVDEYGRYCTGCGHTWKVDGMAPEGLEDL